MRGRPPRRLPPGGWALRVRRRLPAGADCPPAPGLGGDDRRHRGDPRRPSGPGAGADSEPADAAPGLAAGANRRAARMISHFFIDRPIFASVLSIVFVLAGGVAVFTLPVAQYPEVTPPTV